MKFPLKIFLCYNCFVLFLFTQGWSWYAYHHDHNNTTQPKIWRSCCRRWRRRRVSFKTTKKNIRKTTKNDGILGFCKFNFSIFLLSLCMFSYYYFHFFLVHLFNWLQMSVYFLFAFLYFAFLFIYIKSFIKFSAFVLSYLLNKTFLIVNWVFIFHMYVTS